MAKHDDWEIEERQRRQARIDHCHRELRRLERERRAEERRIKPGTPEWYASRAAKALSKRLHERQLRLACPKWVPRAELVAIYAESARLSSETGEPYEVDHIVPLQGANVCGLHVPWNLRVVHRTVNRRKCNKLESA